MEAAIFQLEANDCCLSIVFLQRFVRKVVSVDYVALRIVCDSLLVWQFRLLTSFSNFRSFVGSLFMK